MEVSEVQIESRSESYEKVDRMIDNWAEQAVGAYLTSPVEPQSQDPKTATEASIDARRESEAADIQIRRWLDQRATLRQLQQKRVFSDDNLKTARSLVDKISEDPTKDTPEIYEGHEEIDATALRAIVELLMQGQLTEDEIRIWRASPATRFAHVGDVAEQQGVLAVYQAFKGDPNLDQSKLIARVVGVMTDTETADDLVIPQASQTLQTESGNKQIMESVAMTTAGVPLQASPRDNHLIEGQMLQQLLTMASPALQQPQSDPKVMKSLGMNLNHLGSHLQLAEQLGQMKNPQMQELAKFYQQFKTDLTQVAQLHAEMAGVQQAVTQKIASEGLPPAPTATEPAQPSTPNASQEGLPPPSG
jgi:hypothetical protein